MIIGVPTEVKNNEYRVAATPAGVAELTTHGHRVVIQSGAVIGSVLIPGAAAPKLGTDAMVAQMRPGSVLVDIAIDQGGCFEGSRPTTYDNPTFPVHAAVYYCVANMPGAVHRTSTISLTNATLPYALTLADKGWNRALTEDAALAKGLNTHDGHLTNAAVGEAHGIVTSPVAATLAA